MKDDGAKRGAALAAIAVLVVYVVVHELGSSAYDDSYFFKRFALHAIEDGVYAWNLEDGPVHGSTSQLFGLLTTLVASFTKSHFIAAVRVVDGALLIATGAVLLRGARGPMAMLVLGNALVLSTVRSNMETALALFVLACALVREVRPAAWSRRHDVGSAAATVLVYLARPDAAAIVGVCALLLRRFENRPLGTYVLALLGMMAAVWGVCWAYYGTALPLSFHMKTMALHTYGPHIASLRWLVKGPNLMAVGFVAAPLLWVWVRGGGPKRRDATLALSVAGLVFIVYHLASTHEIMGYRARFYVPALVPLGLAAARVWPREGLPPRAVASFVLPWSACAAAAYVLGWSPNAAGGALKALPWPTYLAFVLATTVALARPSRVWVVGLSLLGGAALWLPPEAPVLRSDVEVLIRHNRELTTTRGVFDVARCLPPKSTVYHSEMGITGMVLYRMRVVDMAGLLSSDIASQGLRFEQRCAAERPEAIFLPHRSYRALNEEVTSAACFADYVRVVDRSSSALHVRVDLVADFRACGSEYREWVGRR
ncbi:MAG: hypothetical protein ACE37F_28800 [Nannocystaceae bacterium]|nr:hypothetical protein [bacterium]